MVKVCKVYCVYFGDRRGGISQSPSNDSDVLDVFRKNIEHDKIFDCGVENMDIIVVVNYNQYANAKCHEYIKLIDGELMPFGKIIVFERENIGGSMGAFSFAFDKFENNYDYWLFVEDDYKIIYPEYFKMIIEEFKYDDNLGFLALTRIISKETSNMHVSGGLGASKREILMEVKKKYGKLPYDTSGVNNYGKFGNSEIMFTNCYYKMGYNIRIPKRTDLVTLSDNWRDNKPHRVWQEEMRFDLKNKKFLFHVGI